MLKCSGETDEKRCFCKSFAISSRPTPASCRAECQLRCEFVLGCHWDCIQSSLRLLLSGPQYGIRELCLRMAANSSDSSKYEIAARGTGTSSGVWRVCVAKHHPLISCAVSINASCYILDFVSRKWRIKPSQLSESKR